MTLKRRIEKIHRKAHRLSDGKNPDHKFGYYESLVGIFMDDFKEIKKELKEVSKQNKYLWQTLEELLKKQLKGGNKK